MVQVQILGKVHKTYKTEGIELLKIVAKNYLIIPVSILTLSLLVNSKGFW